MGDVEAYRLHSEGKYGESDKKNIQYLVEGMDKFINEFEVKKPFVATRYISRKSEKDRKSVV